MAGYHGFVQSVIRQGIDAYQLTLGIYRGNDGDRTDDTAGTEAVGQFLVYRADIAIEDDRTILFPDRELSKCMDAFHNSSDPGSAGEGLEMQRTVGGIAARICREVSDFLIERNTPHVNGAH